MQVMPYRAHTNTHDRNIFMGLEQETRGISESWERVFTLEEVMRFGHSDWWNGVIQKLFNIISVDDFVARLKISGVELNAALVYLSRQRDRLPVFFKSILIWKEIAILAGTFPNAEAIREERKWLKRFKKARKKRRYTIYGGTRQFHFLNEIAEHQGRSLTDLLTEALNQELDQFAQGFGFDTYKVLEEALEAHNLDIEGLQRYNLTAYDLHAAKVRFRDDFYDQQLSFKKVRDWKPIAIAVGTYNCSLIC